ncbi:MAG: rhamnan synthesis F family protein [Tateyamaria sp.]|uniref:rhamnan synthesis F family protein n=1 Tax=Tateyamaria sp. TaxID=1929288 RepID=UPI00329AA9CD
MRSAEKRDPDRMAIPDTFIKFLDRYPEALITPPKDFDTDWYTLTYPDVNKSLCDPLEHFMLYGHAEGRRANSLHRSKDVAHARLDKLKEPQPSDELALFVTFAPGGKIKPHVPQYLCALKQAGISTILIVAADNPDAVQTVDLIEKVDGLFVRQNGGFDFAAWAHVAREIEFTGVRSIFLVNDSLVGPFTIKGFNHILARVRGSDAELIGMTNSIELKQHLQSYFVVAKNDGVGALLDFLKTVRILEDKWQVIFSYEIQMASYFRSRGLTAEPLFPSFESTNPTVQLWRELIAQGFPFVKVEVIRNPNTIGWKSVLRAEGFDVEVAEKSVDLINTLTNNETISNKTTENQ